MLPACEGLEQTCSLRALLVLNGSGLLWAQYGPNPGGNEEDAVILLIPLLLIFLAVTVGVILIATLVWLVLRYALGRAKPGSDPTWEKVPPHDTSIK